MFKVATLMLTIMLLVALTAPVIADTGLEQKVADLANRVTALEQLLRTTPTAFNSTFVGTGNADTLPFTVTTVPWRIDWTTNSQKPSGGVLLINIMVGSNTVPEVYYVIELQPGVTTGYTYSYAPVGTYHISVGTSVEVSWQVKVSQ